MGLCPPVRLKVRAESCGEAGRVSAVRRQGPVAVGLKVAVEPQFPGARVLT